MRPTVGDGENEGANRDLVRVREHGCKIESICQALIEGEQSGDAERFDFDAFKLRKTTQWG